MGSYDLLEKNKSTYFALYSFRRQGSLGVGIVRLVALRAKDTTSVL